MPLELNGTTGVQGNSGAFVAGTAVTASGTSISFTGIPSWVKRITVMYSSLTKASGTSALAVRIGPAGGVVSSGYLGASMYNNGGGAAAVQTTAFCINNGNSSGDVVHGITVISNITGNTWCCTSILAQSNTAYFLFGGGSVALSGALTQLQLTNLTGTDTFGSGTVNILYE